MEPVDFRRSRRELVTELSRQIERRVGKGKKTEEFMRTISKPGKPGQRILEEIGKLAEKCKQDVKRGQPG